MDSLWPWLAVAGLGALHGLSPTTGWMFAVAWGVRERSAAGVRRALLPIAIGHAASVAIVAVVLARGATMDLGLFQLMAGALLLGAAAYCLLRGTGQHRPLSSEAGHTGIALWSFLMASAHGAGLMLISAPAPMCLADGSTRAIAASGSLLLALAAVVVHTAAMLLTTGVIASGVCRGLALHPRLIDGTRLRQTWPAALAITGVLLMASR
ncbi:MAG TPA: hypothetical protein VLI06_19880 [Solimonas sp.]|nr:hypothetical protein [Solimonas sp.]